MKTWVRRTARVGILSAGFLLVGGIATAANATPAHHAEGLTQVSAANKGIANGTQVAIPVQVPVNACGNGVGVVGVGIGVSGNCDNGAVNTESAHTESAQVSAGNQGIGNGTQVHAPIQVPVNVDGNGVGVAGVGIGVSGNADNGAVNTESAHTTEAAQGSLGNDGILNGTQVYAPIQVPVNVCGNGVGVLGVGLGVSGNCSDGAVNTESAHSTEDVRQGSIGNQGILNGTQAYVPIQVPVNVCGNGVGVLGAGIGVSGNCDNGAAIGESGHTYGDESAKAPKAHKAAKAPKAALPTTKVAKADKPADMPMAMDRDGVSQVSAGNAGIANGTQVYAPIQVPVNVAGNGVGVLGVGAGVNGNTSNGALLG